MEKDKELNSQLKGEVNHRFEDLFKKIGNNRPQLSNKVIAEYKEINKELNRDKVDAQRASEILHQVSGVEKMAARQLPHLEKVMVKPAVATPAAIKPAVVKPVATKPAVAPKPKATVSAKPAGKSSTAKKKK